MCPVYAIFPNKRKEIHKKCMKWNLKKELNITLHCTTAHDFHSLDGLSLTVQPFTLALKMKNYQITDTRSNQSRDTQRTTTNTKPQMRQITADSFRFMCVCGKVQNLGCVWKKKHEHHHTATKIIHKLYCYCYLRYMSVSICVYVKLFRFFFFVAVPDSSLLNRQSGMTDQSLLD